MPGRVRHPQPGDTGRRKIAPGSLVAAMDAKLRRAGGARATACASRSSSRCSARSRRRAASRGPTWTASGRRPDLRGPQPHPVRQPSPRLKTTPISIIPGPTARPARFPKLKPLARQAPDSRYGEHSVTARCGHRRPEGEQPASRAVTANILESGGPTTGARLDWIGASAGQAVVDAGDPAAARHRYRQNRRQQGVAP
jgi:hypothetical protein